jgi:hypothetical protein
VSEDVYSGPPRVFASRHFLEPGIPTLDVGRTTMKEILYIQAGDFANHVGAHFWNTQENYLSSAGNGEDEDVVVEHTRSFRESWTSKVREIHFREEAMLIQNIVRGSLFTLLEL